MFNPFAEVAESGSVDADLVDQAKNGDRSALEKLVLRHQAWIYNIAVRMVLRPQDAEEVTQEVLVKVITKLSTFRGESKFRTWQAAKGRFRPGLLTRLFATLSAKREQGRYSRPPWRVTRYLQTRLTLSGIRASQRKSSRKSWEKRGFLRAV